MMKQTYLKVLFSRTATVCATQEIIQGSMGGGSGRGLVGFVHTTPPCIIALFYSESAVAIVQVALTHREFPALEPNVLLLICHVIE